MLKDQILLKFDEKNKNDRIYLNIDFTKDQKKEYVKWDENGFYEIHYNHLDTLNNIFKKVYFNGEKCVEKYDNRKVFGEVGHPEDFEISLNKISHRVDNFRIDDNNQLIADVLILSTHNGDILKNLINKEEIAFSMRSMGSVENGIAKIQKIIAFDAIHKNAWSYDS